MSCDGDGTADEEAMEEDEDEEVIEEVMAPPLPKPSRQPVAAKQLKMTKTKLEKSDKFESMSEKVIKFFHKTPSRFKMKPDPKEHSGN